MCIENKPVAAGGAENFRRRLSATCYINVTSGLIANAEALQKCIYLAEKGLPLLWIPLNAGGVNSPTTTTGSMVSMLAGTLLGIVLVQLVNDSTLIGVIPCILRQKQSVHQNVDDVIGRFRVGTDVQFGLLAMPYASHNG